MAARFGFDLDWGTSGRVADERTRLPGDLRRRVLFSELLTAAARFQTEADSTKLSLCARSSAGAAWARNRSTQDTDLLHVHQLKKRDL